VTRPTQYVRQRAISDRGIELQARIDRFLHDSLTPFLHEVRTELREMTGDAEQIERHLRGDGRVPARVDATVPPARAAQRRIG
jgi:hypothetical protein